MNVITDLEIIRSALMFGEIDDAESRIGRKVRSYSAAYALTKKKKYEAAINLLKRMDEILRGKEKCESILEFAEQIGNAGFPQVGPREASEYLENLVYYLKIMIDRYSIKFPKFDSKRCSDL